MLRNIAGNLLGQLGSVLVIFIATPFYIGLLGPEGYGLIAFFITLQGLIAFLDMGLSITATREVAMRQDESGGQLHDILKTLERLYMTVGLVIAILIVVAAEFIATQWLELSTLDSDEASNAIRLMGLMFGIRWPNALYNGILRGLERHIEINLVMLLANTIKAGGAIALLTATGPSMLTYSAWFLCVSVFEMLLLRSMCSRGHSSIRLSEGSASLHSLLLVHKFALGVAATSLAAVLIKNLDKLMISGLLPMSELGYYQLGALISMGWLVIVSSVMTVYFPHFSKLSGEDVQPALRSKYGEAVAIVALLMSPICVFIAANAYEILAIWTQSPETARRAESVLTILAIAGVFNCVMQPLISLQFATGLSWLPAANNLIALIFIAPLIYFNVTRFGIEGGAYAWLTFNVIYFFVFPIVLHRIVLKGFYREFLVKRTLPPMLAAAVVFTGIECLHVPGSLWGSLLVSLGIAAVFYGAFAWVYCRKLGLRYAF